MLRKCIVSLAVFLLICRPLSAQQPPDEFYAARGNYLTVKVAVLGPGDPVYLWWGHIGLVIEDAMSGETHFYDWGVFSFDTENFYTNFAFGRLLYRCEESPAELNIEWNIRANRDITLYTLDLPPEVRTEIFMRAENNALPENSEYWYHHFKDNCATRVLDLIDIATGGAFKERYGQAPGRFTLRQHVRRHTWFSPFWDWLLNFLMGQDIDRPITVWEEMFLPSEIGRNIADFRYTDPSGIERQLVSSVEVLNRVPGKPAVLEKPRRQWIRELVLGLFIALCFGFLTLNGGKHKKLFHTISCLSQSALGLFFGTVGFLLLFMSFFTDHDYTYHNSNLIFINPLLLAAVPLGIICIAGRSAAGRFRAGILLKSLWTAVFLGGLVTMVIKLFPGFYQQNQVTQVLVLPFAFVLSFFPDWIKKTGNRNGKRGK